MPTRPGLTRDECPKQTRRTPGFTLLEMAIVIFIMGIMLVAGLRLLSTRADRAQGDATRASQEAIKSALIAYLGRNRRLPCPDTDLDGRENRQAPPNPCVAYVGRVPYLDLGLQQAGVLDGWDNYINYVVTPPVLDPVLVPPAPPATQWNTAWLYSYVDPIVDANTQTNVGASAFWPTTATGGIVVKDVANNLIANPATPPLGAAVVLISYGKNGMGAMNVKGVQNDSTAAVFDELRNISPVISAGKIEVYDRDVTDEIVPSHGPFDDLVMVMRANDLIAPLIANGTVTGSATAALSHANDIVIGLTVANPSAGPPCTHVYALPPSPVVFTGLASDWGVSYALIAPPAINCTTPAAGTAYTLTAGDGTQRTVSVAEVIGVINSRAAGFGP